MDKIFKLWVTHSLILDSVLGISSSCSFVLQADDGLCWIDTNCEKEEAEYTKIRAVLKQEALRSEASLILTGDTKALCCCYCSVAESLCDRTLWSHGLQHARRLCPPLFLSLLKFMSTELVMPCNHLILCRLLHFVPSTFPSIRVFSNESALCKRWLNDWSFSISPSNEYS